jgi:hypothetical protein
MKTGWGVETLSRWLLKNSPVRYLEIIRVYSRSFVVSHLKHHFVYREDWRGQRERARKGSSAHRNHQQQA